MTKLQSITAAIISVLALGLGILRFFKPTYPIDSTTLGLLGLAVLPWLSLFFKKFKIPGIVEGESHDRAQGVTPPAPPKVVAPAEIPPAVEMAVKFRNFGGPAKKVLRTLWRYQKQQFKDDYNRRWTFAVFPNAPDFPEYIEGLGELLKKNLISMNPENHQVALSNEGIILMESTDENNIRGDFYVF